MKNFRVQIHYEGYRGETNVMAEDTKESVEKSILDKLGEKSIKWESTGMFDHTRRITYEEVTNDPRPVHYEEVLGVRMATRAPEGREA